MKYPMDTVRQAHASMWLANRDFQAGKISFDELAELRNSIMMRMPAYEAGPRRQSLDSWLKSTSAGLILRQV
jgi:hypothetical protein